MITITTNMLASVAALEIPWGLRLLPCPHCDHVHYDVEQQGWGDCPVPLCGCLLLPPWVTGKFGPVDIKRLYLWMKENL